MMTHLEQQFVLQLQSLVDDAPRRRYLLAVSGGRDSSVLAHLFHQHHLDFALAHCNFHLRGTESDRDEQFVRTLAEKYDKPLFVKQFDTLKVQKASGRSVEMVARDLRYAWFAELAADYDYIVTAHHANDNAETLIMNLLRGTGLKGLTGIPAKNGQILRPLLTFTAEEIEQYAQEKHLSYCIDQTNLSNQYQRNKIRWEVLPKLQEMNPKIVATLCQNIAHLKQQYSFYHSEIQKILNNLVFKSSDYFLISIDRLLEEKHAKLLLYEWLNPMGFTEDTVQKIYVGLRGRSGVVFSSPTHELLKDRRFLILRERPTHPEAPIFCQNMAELERQGFSVSRHPISEPPTFTRNTDVLFVDAEKLHFPLTLRHWRAGDAFQPLGMSGWQKLSDLFNNAKVNRFDKERILILCSENQIVWVVGHRADDRFKIDETTPYYYKITYHGRD
ncbi:MAG: tRNA lysidine(34) synthetase TilS [Bacteroidales bacterium]|nr:tRNA lysidine(34) synthetase TilS [Bacteroidales bacterium]